MAVRPVAGEAEFFRLPPAPLRGHIRRYCLDARLSQPLNDVVAQLAFDGLKAVACIEPAEVRSLFLFALQLTGVIIASKDDREHGEVFIFYLGIRVEFFVGFSRCPEEIADLFFVVGIERVISRSKTAVDLGPDFFLRVADSRRNYWSWSQRRILVLIA